jgi:hypothetical protein
MSFRLSIALFLFFSVSYLLQSYFLLPIEAHLRNDPSVELYSFCYLPHGFKAIAVVLTGGQALIPMLFANIVVDLSSGMEFARAIKAAVLGTGCFAVALITLNLLRTQPIFSSPFNSSSPSMQNLSSLLAIALISSFVNGLASSVFWGSKINEVAVMFFIGDLIGSVVVFGLFHLMNKKMLMLIKNLRVSAKARIQ